jgi:hypothetical protein
VRPFDPARPASVWYVPGTPTKKLYFDLTIHKDIFPGMDPTVLVYDTSGMGPSYAKNPEREVDLRPHPPTIQPLGTGLGNMRMTEFPRYVELQEHVLAKLGLDPADFRAYRVAIRYPLVSDQILQAFVG